MIMLSELRQQHGVTQQVLADLLGVTRQTYARIEKDGNMSLGQAAKLAEFFAVNISSFYPDTHKEAETTFDRSKYKQIIQNFIKYGASTDGKITKTKLAKLCYLLDFTRFYHNFTSITGLEYRRNQQGPVPDLYFTTLEEMQAEESIAVEQKGQAFLLSTIGTVQDDLLSEDELMWIKKIAQKWQTATTQDIVDFTHQQLPWKICYDKEIIPYDLITQEDDDNIY